MELIPLIADALLYLIGLLVLIIIFTVVSKKLRKKPEEEPAPAKPAVVSVSLEPENKSKPLGSSEPKSEKIEVPGRNFLDQPSVQKKSEPKVDFLSGGATEPKNITIKPKDGGDDLFKVKEEKSNARRYKPRQNKSFRDSTPRFQILNNDFGSGNNESDDSGKQDDPIDENDKKQS